MKSVPFGMVMIVVAGGLLTGCPPIETTIPAEKEIEVPGTGILGGNPLLPEQAFPADLVGDALAQSIQDSFDTSGYDKSAVKSLKLTALSLTVVDPEEGGQTVRHLGFLQSLTLFLGPEGGDAIKVAESDAGAFDENPTAYVMPLTDAELAEAFKSADAMTMTADVAPSDPPTFNTTVLVASELTVQIGL